MRYAGTIFVLAGIIVFLTACRLQNEWTRTHPKEIEDPVDVHLRPGTWGKKENHRVYRGEW